MRLPADTVADFGRHRDLMGITRLADLTGLDVVGIPVWTAIRPNSRSLSVSQGKGATRDAARASALMESIEYWHAEHVDLPLRFESYRALARTHPVIDAFSLPVRGDVDGVDAKSPRTPARATFDPVRPMLWVEGRDLVDGGATWVPFDTVRLNKVGLDYAQTVFRVGSNGLASGNTDAEALLHGLCELVERDAVTQWWGGVRSRADVRRHAVDLASITDPGCRDLLDRFVAAGVDVAVLGCTSDVGVPTFQCCVADSAARAAWRPFGAYWGYGTHPDPTIALSRALTEAAQSRVTAIAASRDENFRSKYDVQNDAGRLATVRRVFFAEPGTVDGGSIPRPEHRSIAADVDAVLDRLRSRGLRQVVAVDLTKPELGIPVVKVIVPGLSFSSLFVGFAPGTSARPCPGPLSPR